MRLFSNRSQRTSKCGKNISDTLGCASCATFLFLPHFDVICDLLLNRRTATWNLFVKLSSVSEKTSSGRQISHQAATSCQVAILPFSNINILSVITPASSYHETLSRFNLCTLKERRSGLCEKLFTSIKLDKEHKLHHFLPEKNLSTYSLRKPRPFKNFKARTNRFKNTFFPAMTII